jgi:hypothetical protein
MNTRSVKHFLWRLALLSNLTPLSTAFAQGTAFTYQGRLDDGGTAANGTYDFSFALFATNAGGSAIAGPVTNADVNVREGLFTVSLDFGPEAFPGARRWLEIIAATNGAPGIRLSPRQEILPAPYAILATLAGGVPAEAITQAMIAPGAIGSNQLADDAVIAGKLANGAVLERTISTGAVTTTKIEDAAVTNAKLADNSVSARILADASVNSAEIAGDAVTTAKIADAAVTSQKLSASIQLGDFSTSGHLTLWNGSDNQKGLDLFGQTGRVLVYGGDGVPRGSFSGQPAGRLQLNNTTGNTTTISLDADEGIRTTGPIRVASSISGGTVGLDLNRTSAGGQVVTLDENGVTSGQLGTGISGGFLQLNQAGGQAGFVADGDAGNNNGGTLTVNQADGDIGVFMDGDSGGAGLLQVRAVSGVTHVTVDGADADGSGNVTVYQEDGQLGVAIDGASSRSGSGEITVYSKGAANIAQLFEGEDGGGALTLSYTNDGLRCRLDAGPEDFGGGVLELYGPNEGKAVEISAFLAGVGQIELYDNAGSVGTSINGQSGSRIAGSLGVDRIPAANELEVEGTASKTSAGSWLANSDARIKTNVETITNALHTLSRIRPVKFSYTSDYLQRHPRLANATYFNVIAQEFAEVFPESVSEGGDTLPNGDRVLQVDTHPAEITALAAIQELHALVKAQEKRIAALEARLAASESTVTQATIIQPGGVK